MQLRTEDLWPGGPCLAQGEGGFKLSTDSVLLADFVRTPGARRAVDLGCGTGVQIEPNLVLCNCGGTASEEMKRIYHISGG